MFNSLFSKLKIILGNQDGNKPVIPDSKVNIKSKNQGTVSTNDEEKNRVSLKKKKSHKEPTQPLQPKQPKIDQQVYDKKLTEIEKLQQDIKTKEQEIFRRLSSLDDKEKYLLEKERNIDRKTEEVDKRKEMIDDVYRKQVEKLEQISGVDIDKAKQLIMKATEKRMADWIARKIEEAKERIKENQEEVAQEILVDAIKHGAADYVAEYTVSSMTIADEKIKGKIIGREGRNIRTFEKETGVELELDDGNEIRISSFDSTRREVAKMAMERLVKDGRIQPIKIAQIVAQTKMDMDKILLNEGRKICAEIGVFNLPTDLIKMIGKFKFRYSFGQNLAQHTIEATKIATALAYELKANVSVVKMGTLLHDIGKVITDQEGSHVDLGVEYLRRLRIPQEVINCVEEHHEDKEFSSVESIIVYLGDATSGARPGARYENHEEYLKRMTNIEDIVKSFEGVKSVAAYQAGREVMVIVDPDRVNDSEAKVLCQDIAEKLDEEAKWAGQIKVTLIRELKISNIGNGDKNNKNAVKSEN